MNLDCFSESGPADLSKREMAHESGATTASDKTPLLQDRLMRSLSGVDQHEQYGKTLFLDFHLLLLLFLLSLLLL